MTSTKTKSPKSASAKTADHKTAAKPASKRSIVVHDDAIKLLVADHKEVKALFKDYEKLVKDEADGDDRQALAQKICLLLTVHATIEEEIFYPAARAAIEDSALLDEAEVEHASAKDLIAQIEGMSPDEDLYDAKVKVLGEYIEHHVKEEETELFPEVKKSDVDLAELGADMVSRKETLLAELGEDAMA